MVLKIPPITVCPHCGFESEDDDEMCRACGELIEDNMFVRNVSLTHVLGNFFSGLQNKGFQGLDHDDELFKEDPDFDSGWSLLSSNIYNDDDD